MEKTEKVNQDSKGLKNSRYWENVIPKTDKKTPAEEGRLPDARNPKRLKELH